MNVVIYCRYSSELQNPKSCDDQEREIRAGLARLGIDASNADVIRDAAEPGTTTDRDGFDTICTLIRSNEPFILAVDDQSRFTRLGNAFALITDLVFAGGRFISICEQIDTTVTGWKLKVRVMELHNSQCSDESSSRVRRGQRGRVLDGKSAGDFPYGFESFPIDPDYARLYCGRGPKPVMGVRNNPYEAKWVIWIFRQFAEGQSINWIARELTRRTVPKGGRARFKDWYAPTIRAMLSNAKYIGRWTWGRSTTLRNSVGKKKPMPAAEDEVVDVERPNLRIIPQELWEQVQLRLANLRQRTGYKAGQPSRRPIVHYTVDYPNDVLMTLLVCGYCGGKMHHAGSGEHVYRQCANSVDGREECKEKLRVPATKARAVLLGFVATLLQCMPEWISRAVDEMRTAIQDFQSHVPAELDVLRDQLRNAEQRRDNLMVIAESGGVNDLEDFKLRLRRADEDAKQHRCELERLESLPVAKLSMPDGKWIMKRLQELAATLASDQAATARLLQELIGTVRVFRVIPIGKQFGYQQLRFRVSGWKAVRAALRGRVPLEVLEIVERHRQVDGDDSPEFCLDVGGPHKLDILAPRIAELRSQGMKWKDIAAETGVSMDSAWQCWRRYVDALAASTPTPTDKRHDERNEDVPEEDENLNDGHGAA